MQKFKFKNSFKNEGALKYWKVTNEFDASVVVRVSHGWLIECAE